MKYDEPFNHGIDMIVTFGGALAHDRQQVEEGLKRLADAGTNTLFSAMMMWAEVLIETGGVGQDGIVLTARDVDPDNPRDPALFVAQFVGACHREDIEMAEALFLAPVNGGDPEQVMSNCRELLAAVGALRGAAL